MSAGDPPPYGWVPPHGLHPSLDNPRILEIERRQAEQDARQAALEKRVAELEQQVARQVPWWPTHPEVSDPVMEDVPTCRVCGLRFEGVMGYVCPRSDCPSGISYCSAHTSEGVPIPEHLRDAHLKAHSVLIQPPEQGPIRYGR